ncbi:MAG: hypothetical protein D6760_09950, partial [Deltaproteobacteria bacterium]
MSEARDQAPKQRRQATVLFADISGFSSLAERLDPEELTDLVSRCFRIVEQIILERGGAIDKYIGDCVMALFGAPRALEDAPRQAINAAIAIRDAIGRLNESAHLPAHVGVHIGINSGLVVAGEVGGERHRDYTVMGSTVNLAERLQSAAPTGCIYVGPDTYAETCTMFEFRQLDPLRLAGIAEPVTAYEVLSRREQLHRMRPHGRQLRRLVSPLVGRDRELTLLRQRFERLTQGEGGVVTIVGDAGVGKSRLLAEACLLPIVERLRLLEARCLSVGRALGFHPFVDLIETAAGISPGWPTSRRYAALRKLVEEADPEQAAEILPPLARLMGVADEPGHDELEGVSGDALEKMIHRAMSRLLVAASRTRPVVLVFEDLHWADRSSLGLLQALIDVAAAAPILFVLLARPGFEDTSELITRYLREKTSIDVQTVALAPLAAPDCDRLIDNLFGSATVPPTLRDMIKRRSEGNPFYVEEVIRILLDKGVVRRQHGQIELLQESELVRVPATIEGILLARIEQLDEPARNVLQIASVIGRRFYHRIIADIVEADCDLDAALEQLMAKELIFERSTRGTSSRRRLLLAAERQYVFKHALMQQVAYENIALQRRREIHRRCAVAVEKLFRDRIQDAYGMLAYHFTQAGESTRAEEYLVKAGEEAARAAA